MLKECNIIIQPQVNLILVLNATNGVEKLLKKQKQKREKNKDTNNIVEEKL